MDSHGQCDESTLVQSTPPVATKATVTRTEVSNVSCSHDKTHACTFCLLAQTTHRPAGPLSSILDTAAKTTGESAQIPSQIRDQMKNPGNPEVTYCYLFSSVFPGDFK